METGSWINLTPAINFKIKYDKIKAMKKEIKKGSIVAYDGGNFRVTARFAHSVNLGSIFGSKIYHKHVPVDQVTEDQKGWYERWTQSETYRCM